MAALRSTFVRPLMIVAGIAGAAALVASLLLVVNSHQALQRIEPAAEHIRHLELLNEAARDTQQLFINHEAERRVPTALEIEAIRRKLSLLISQDHHLAAESPTRLKTARDALDGFADDPHAALLASLAEVRTVILEETKAQSALIQKMRGDWQAEYRIAIGTFLGLPALAILALAILRRQILGSLSRVSFLMEQLANGSFVPTPVDGADFDLRPVLLSYNGLVERLAKAEAENNQRQAQLEEQVRAATHTLLRQGRELSEADRLAAVGETSARIAHELRNPLAGLELGLKNLSADCSSDRRGADASIKARFGPMISELQRMSRLLNQLLDQARRTPEAATRIDIRKETNETAALARYQTAAGIKIEVDADDHLNCDVPRDAFRQILFNLILNATQAIGEHSGVVEVSARRKADRLSLAIRDTGPGFPEYVLLTGPRMFMTRRPGGSGLGLATVRRLVDQMGGEMKLSNAPASGAVVEISIPCDGNHA
ncbi:MAG: sensor histidine kinase [Hyphomicrobiaceae bacterium]